MKSLGSVLRLALVYRWTMCGVLASAAAAAVLWGTNLSTVFPIVDVVLQRQSMRDWVDRRITASEAAGQGPAGKVDRDRVRCAE